MASISIADVTLHLDESLSKEDRAKLESSLRSQPGVIGLDWSNKAPHLMIIKYDPEHATSRAIVKAVLGDGLHGELFGL